MAPRLENADEGCYNLRARKLPPSQNICKVLNTSIVRKGKRKKPKDDEDILFIKEIPSSNLRGKYRDKLQYCTSMEQEILKGNMLSDMTINYTLLILHRQFPQVNGLEDTELGPRGLFSSHKGKFIQILYGDSHWILVAGTTNDESNNDISVYDSSNNGKVWPCFMKQVCHLHKTEKNKLRVSIQSVQQQKNKVDCGVLVICFAVDLLFNINPVGQKYDLEKLRTHLNGCLLNGVFSEFPRCEKKKSPRRSNACKEVKLTFRICHMCRSSSSTPDEDEEESDVILCSNCGNFFHSDCESVPLEYLSTSTSSGSWICSFCSNMPS